MGNVWDRTVEVLRGRAAILGPIAAAAIFLPAIVNNAVAAFVTPGSRGVALLAMVVALGVLVANVWGQLAMLAVATHPATTRADATRQATQRLLPALGALFVLAVIFALAIVPPMIALVRAGVDLTNRAAVQSMPAGIAGFVGLYSLVLLVVILFIGARLILLNPVVLNERRGVGALMRSVRLTKGMTFRIVGLMILFGIVVLIPTMAVQSIVGLVFRLILGANGIPVTVFVASAAGAAVTTVFTVVAAAFTAQLYVAAVAEEEVA
ncbi:hypothetical protein Q5H91_00560 [Sphingomonas sp. KR1UV-12]|uniref:DUF7847 domain-containing protein n=1 Tax=Sphingomonas aurea TaxID=3063994 RepID=A0ABT9EFE4_9SPHN|nr:hypothetical protein [Sphingomonas sp. KR1UV-12]MDP1025692.1 hypothetical protein [Sphingomonas sp. KR1UV-12]